MQWSPAYLLEYTTLATNHNPLEDGELFRFYIDIHQVNVSNNLLHYSNPLVLHIQSCLPIRCGFHYITYLVHTVF